MLISEVTLSLEIPFILMEQSITTLTLLDNQTCLTRHPIKCTTGHLSVAFQPINCLGNVVKKLNKWDFPSGNYGNTFTVFVIMSTHSLYIHTAKLHLANCLITLRYEAVAHASININSGTGKHDYVTLRHA